MKKTVSLIIPTYNETNNVKAIFEKIEEVFQTLEYQWEVIFVDDGSHDNSLECIKSLAATHSNCLFISFSRNFGKDAALKAGLDHSKGDVVITIDADLQHPPSLLFEMIKQWEEGFDVVYAYRKGTNPHTSIFHKLASRVFWVILNHLSDLKLEDGISDYRLLDRKVVDVLKSLDEFELFLRGMVKWVGFKQKGIEYVPDQRYYGESAYSLKSLIKLAIYSITSFSIKPLYVAIYMGFTFSALSTLYIPYVIYSIYLNTQVPGWSSVIMTIVFFGGIQLMMLGIIGIYIGKMFMQTKHRPNYIIQTDNLIK
jgi:dolichol-phosphate mannosyltransferase